jgi:hypothetical protein
MHLRPAIFIFLLSLLLALLTLPYSPKPSSKNLKVMPTLGKHPRELESEMSSLKCSDMENAVERLEPVIIQDDSSISLDHYFVPIHYKDTLDCLLVPHGTILSRIDKLAMDIIQDYKGQTIYLLCVLKGDF